MGIDWKKIKQKAVDIAIDAGSDFARSAERKTAELERVAEKKARERGSSLSHEAYEELDRRYEASYNMQDSMDDLKYRYHSKYRDDED